MTGYAPDEIDLYVPHQANKRILDGIAKRLGIPEEKVVLTLARHSEQVAVRAPVIDTAPDARMVLRPIDVVRTAGVRIVRGAAAAADRRPPGLPRFPGLDPLALGKPSGGGACFR